MLVGRVCPFTGAKNTMEIDVTAAQMLDWECGTLIQYAMPNLNADEREFIMTGITPQIWDDVMSDNDTD